MSSEVSLDALAVRIIDYVESYPWNNQYTLAGRAAQVEAVKERLIQAYNLGAEKMAESLGIAAAGCGDAGCVEHGFTGPSAAQMPGPSVLPWQAGPRLDDVAATMTRAFFREDGSSETS